MKLSLLFLIAAAFAGSIAASAAPTTVTVHADRVAGELRPIWNWFGYDEASLARKFVAS